MSILAPQYLYPWVFDGVPAFQISAICVLLAFLLAFLNKSIDLSVYRHKQNICLALLFILVHLSDWLSPFQQGSRAADKNLVISTLNTIFLMYFVSLPFLMSEKALKWLLLTFLSVLVYYVYWSNLAYFSFDISKFNMGRLMGPSGTPYKDENKFSVLFVVGAPFFLFGIFFLEKRLYKFLCGLTLLFLWHAIFLTGSRAALLACIVTTLFAAKLINSKKIRLVLVLGFFAIVVDQGAESFSRSSETIANAQERENEPIDPRVSSWTAGLGFMAEHPLLGIGTQRFQEATRHYYPEKHPYVAHNTFISIASESGLIAGFIFLYIYVLNFQQTRRALKEDNEINRFNEYLMKASLTALTGFYICSMFLDLLIYEMFYLLLLIMLANHIVSAAQSKRE